MKRRLMVLNIVFAVIFLFAAAVQYNDPDPFRWIAIYGAAAAVCFLVASARVGTMLPLVVGLVALGWALTILPGLFGESIAPDQVFGTMHMANYAVEETREMLGLTVVSAWMLFLAYYQHSHPGKS